MEILAVSPGCSLIGLIGNTADPADGYGFQTRCTFNESNNGPIVFIKGSNFLPTVIPCSSVYSRWRMIIVDFFFDTRVCCILRILSPTNNEHDVCVIIFPVFLCPRIFIYLFIIPSVVIDHSVCMTYFIKMDARTRLFYLVITVAFAGGFCVMVKIAFEKILSSLFRNAKQRMEWKGIDWGG